MEVSGLARVQENAAAQGDTDFIARELPRLLEAHGDLLAHIGRFLEGRQTRPPEEKLPPPTPQELRERVGEALELLEDFQSRECATAVEELLCHALPPEAEERLREIQGQLKLYEDDHAEELLGALLGRLEQEDGSL